MVLCGKQEWEIITRAWGFSWKEDHLTNDATASIRTSSQMDLDEPQAGSATTSTEEKLAKYLALHLACSAHFHVAMADGPAGTQKEIEATTVRIPRSNFLQCPPSARPVIDTINSRGSLVDHDARLEEVIPLVMNEIDPNRFQAVLKGLVNTKTRLPHFGNLKRKTQSRRNIRPVQRKKEDLLFCH
ncbi:hypothetical protein BDZ45DRAFT_692770 [Acephala macrosclerotiorum]|nr:hypothetical protein BDZ45DRAFT_692770 [Acephala macrosclerotiorum]